MLQSSLSKGVTWEVRVCVYWYINDTYPSYLLIAAGDRYILLRV